MRKLIIDDTNNDVIVLTKEQATDELKYMGLMGFLDKYQVEYNFLIENRQHYTMHEFKILLQSGKEVDQKLIEYYVEDGSLDCEFIGELSMKIYSNLNNDFIQKYHDYIDWGKMLIYLTATDQLDPNKYMDIIEDKNLWNIVSSTPLSIEFIREHKDKLKWNMVSFINDFSDDEREEFDGYIVQESKIKFSTDVVKQIGSKDLIEIFKKNGVYETRDVISDTEELTTEEISKLKELLKIIK
jgi:hypothetical protein